MNLLNSFILLFQNTRPVINSEVDNSNLAGALILLLLFIWIVSEIGKGIK